MVRPLINFKSGNGNGMTYHSVREARDLATQGDIVGVLNRGTDPRSIGSNMGIVVCLKPGELRAWKHMPDMEARRVFDVVPGKGNEVLYIRKGNEIGTPEELYSVVEEVCNSFGEGTLTYIGQGGFEKLRTK